MYNSYIKKFGTIEFYIESNQIEKMDSIRRSTASQIKVIILTGLNDKDAQMQKPLIRNGGIRRTKNTEESILG